MKYFLTCDGGGSKLQVVVFDENLRVLGVGRSGGTNQLFSSEALVRRHMEEAIDGALGDVRALEVAYVTIVGSKELFAELLRQRVTVGRLVYHPEMVCLLLAGGLTRHGCVALSGTGSGVSYIDGLPVEHRGGFGMAVGDDGSGWWIGSRGLNAVIRELEGWGPHTALSEKALAFYEIEKVGQLIPALYGRGGEARTRSAAFCPLVGEAADQGDPTALAIIREAGWLMAKQMAALCRLCQVPADMPVICCGGAWRSTPLFQEAFAQVLREEGVLSPVHHGRLQPVLHGAVQMLLDQGIDPWSRIDDLRRMRELI